MLRRFRGPALFRGLRPSSRQGVPFWPSGLTLRSSGRLRRRLPWPLEKFMDIKTAEDIGALQARCMILESRVAALAAFASALLKEHPQRDQIQTRWANHLGPALQEIGPGLGKDEVNMASTLPGWVQHQIDK